MGGHFVSFDIIELIKYILSGLIQGVTEVLPVSSSGHVELSKALLGLKTDDNTFFLIFLNTGSLATFIIIYFKRLLRYVKAFFNFVFYPSKREENKQDTVFLMKILVACIPAGIAGILIKDYLDEMLDANGLLIAGIGLLVTATVIYYVSSSKFRNGKTQVTWPDVLFVGLAQAVAIFPGISRSGMTTSTALKRGSGIVSALDFSFLMYIFISLGTVLLGVYDLTQATVSISNPQLIYYGGAFVAAMGATYIAYRIIFNVFKSGKLKYFSYYCFTAGILSIILFMM